ncbi:MGMT family protein [Halalkalirubrum salinum]|uniref:MGMT family protein n=1 Tax=Halalkalirubrum salinum TaxID=2563889 RepID=UPI0010FB45CB|nr:MGMT family protein [Halalkalirubrum salinum]
MKDAGVYARELESIGRVVQLGIVGGQVISVSFPDAVPEDASVAHDYLDAVDAYLAGEREGLTEISIALTMPTDKRRVLETLREIPSGRTVTIDRLASFAGLDPAEDGVRETVQDALRENPVPLFVPDHRVRDGQGATPSSIAAALRRHENG